MPNLMVIIGSTRPGRAGLPIGQWFADFAGKHSGFDVQVADLAEIDLPLLADPHHPRLKKYVHQHTWDWSAKVESADAFVIVTPEYNYGYPAAVKNALDHLSQEWAYAPVGFVSYGGIAAGTRAVQQLKQVVTTLRMLPVFESVNIPFHAPQIADGVFTPSTATEDAATAMLDELVKVEAGVHGLRAGVRA
ncbi:NAD(P)H-dependent FMN reductase [Actinoplanes octamycinicus]|uniref:NAD(P)H-dependent FMN reductase n=1 Tax=Actinoplanes octamycinicus TaxID=135948 RepID=A0A7W7H343_9ACTN|nr:NAD(P)H-dependent oxidoreductase [Actinoplanes octamycinicus]MBB4743022.1 NAD(P)H-dependent FMN reductase [Actinoplanes octamycinicus]GIE58123.1 reductase [Actinoplanes octamycinicus]